MLVEELAAGVELSVVLGGVVVLDTVVELSAELVGAGLVGAGVGAGCTTFVSLSEHAAMLVHIASAPAPRKTFRMIIASLQNRGVRSAQNAAVTEAGQSICRVGDCLMAATRPTPQATGRSQNAIVLRADDLPGRCKRAAARGECVSYKFYLRPNA